MHGTKITFGAMRKQPVEGAPNVTVPMIAARAVDAYGNAWGVLVSAFRATEETVRNLWEHRRDLFTSVQPAPTTPAPSIA